MKYGIGFLIVKAELQNPVKLALLVVVVNHLKHFQGEFFELFATLPLFIFLFRRARHQPGRF